MSDEIQMYGLCTAPMCIEPAENPNAWNPVCKKHRGYFPPRKKDTELETLRAENAALTTALEEIHTNYGHVCEEFETCTHRACASSYGAWAVADEVLRAVRTGTRTGNTPA